MVSSPWPTRPFTYSISLASTSLACRISSSVNRSRGAASRAARLAAITAWAEFLDFLWLRAKEGRKRRPKGKSYVHRGPATSTSPHPLRDPGADGKLGRPFLPAPSPSAVVSPLAPVSRPPHNLSLGLRGWRGGEGSLWLFARLS